MLKKIADALLHRLRKPIRDALRFRVNVDAFLFDTSIIPDYQTYWKLVTDQSALKSHSKFTVVRATVQHESGHNLITDYGLNQFGNLIAGVNSDYMQYNGVGSGSTAADATDTDLETAVGSRKSITNAYVINNVVHLDTHYLNTENNGTIRETIISHASSGANASAHYIFGADFTKDNTKSMLIAWTITQVNA